MTCLEGHTKLGWKCFSDTKVNFNITIDTTLPQFLAQFEAFIEQLIGILNLPPEDLEKFALFDAVEGSVNAQGAVAVNDPEAATAALNAALGSGASIAGFGVLSSSYEGSTPPPPAQP